MSFYLEIGMGDITQKLLADLGTILHTPAAESSFTKMLLDLNMLEFKISVLIDDLQQARSEEEVLAAWASIASVLYSAYRVHHGDTSKNSMLKNGLLEPLIRVVNACVLELSCKKYKEVLSEQKDDAKDIFKLLCAVCEFYSVNDNIPEMLQSIQTTIDFREIAELARTIEDAIFYEFQGSEISRRLTQQNPHGTLDDSVKLLKESVAILKENCVTLIGPDKLILQHNMNALSIAISKQMQALIEAAAEIGPNISVKMDVLYYQCLKLLNEMESCLLKPGVDIAQLRATSYKDLDVATQVASPKPMGNLLATRGLIGLLNSEPIDKLESIFKASLRCMPQDITPQYANLENRYANCCVAYAAVAYLVDHELAKSVAISEHPYAKIAKKLYAGNMYNPGCLSLIRAEDLMQTAADLYVNSWTRTNTKGEGISYGKQAEKFLLSIRNHPACKANKAALAIINNAQPQPTSGYLPSFVGRNKETLAMLVGAVSIAAAGIYLLQDSDQTRATPKLTM